MSISPTLKGAITAALMIISVLVIYNIGENADPRLQYSIYVFYALGIAWTLIAYRRSVGFTGKFGDLFSQGFRCFIIVTLAMALFYGIFNYTHPEFAAKSAEAYREQLLERVKSNDMLPNDVEPAISTYKKQYTLKLVSGAIFGYLIIGAGVTAAVSALLTRRK